MTVDGVTFNINRLAVFLNFATPIVAREYTANEFLNYYSRFLDYYGAGKEQYTLIFLSQVDFDEVIDFARRNAENLYSPLAEKKGQFNNIKDSYLRFDYHLFTWCIKIIDEYTQNPQP